MTVEFKTYMLFTSDLQKAKEELESAEGQLVVGLTDKVFLANIPDSISPGELRFATSEKPAGMDLLSNLMVEVWTNRKPNEMQRLLERLLPENIPMVTRLQNINQIK